MKTLKGARGLVSRKLPGRLAQDKRRIAKNLKLEADFVRSLPNKGRPGVYNDSGISVEERLAEKMWWWLTGSGRKKNNWAQYWIEKHPADSVGTHNLSAREKWLERTLKKVPKGSKILDAGAGELQYKRFCKHLNYVSQDFGQYTGEGDQAGLQMGSWDNSKLDIVSDITEIPAKSSSFDAIMCIEVFEHIPKPIAAIKEFSRLLRPGGQLIITTPFASLTHFAPYFFYNGYSRYFFENILPEYGFDIKEIDLNGNYFEYLAQEIRRLDSVAERYAPKSKKPSALDNLIKHLMLMRLEELTKKDMGSHELLFQGIHVVAVKK